MIRIPDKRAIDTSLTTDGIGMIRESLAKQVCAALGLPEDTSGGPLCLTNTLLTCSFQFSKPDWVASKALSVPTPMISLTA